jgi:hypothetical protein
MSYAAAGSNLFLKTKQHEIVVFRNFLGKNRPGFFSYCADYITMPPVDKSLVPDWVNRVNSVMGLHRMARRYDSLCNSRLHAGSQGLRIGSLKFISLLPYSLADDLEGRLFSKLQKF